MACGNARFVLVGPSKNPSKLHFALDVMADREGLLGTCYGMFLVLATLGSLGGRVRPPRAQNCLSAILSNKGSSTSPQSANKKAPTSGGFFIGGQGGIRTLERLLTVTHFPGVRLQPLGHLSVTLRSGGDTRPGLPPQGPAKPLSQKAFRPVNWPRSYSDCVGTTAKSRLAVTTETV